MTDRTVLADALQGATVEMLREDAAHAAECAALCGEGDARLYTFRRLAALALAVAEMQEGGNAAALAAEDEAEGWGVAWNVYADGDSNLRAYLKRPNSAMSVTCWMPEPPAESNGHPTLPAALASLLRGAP